MFEWFYKRHMKKRLKNAFQLSGVYYETKHNGKTIRRLPHILDVRTYVDKTVFVFRVPHTVNPKDVEKKDHVFRSMFGELIEFKGTYPMTLTVYHKAHNGTYPFIMEELEPHMKKHKLPIIAGKDINGQFHCYDMTENPHLLIAGETGSGKSVMLRSILTSLIIHKRKRLKLFLADMKRSEFHLFRGVDIVEAVLTEKRHVVQCVQYLHDQLKQRGDLLDQHELSHIDKLPNPPDYLVLCIDEFSILRDQKETLEQIADLTALGRALGIFVILSTQRPDRNIVDGLLKANLTVRYAFRHADRINSRITLGDGAKEDASKIDEEDKGKFFMRFSGFKFLQSPYLPEEDEGDVLGAKTLLEPYKSRVKRKPQFNVVDAVVPMIEESEEK